MDSRAYTEKHCIFFLLTLLAGFAVVAILACEAIHLFLQVPNWPIFLAVGVGVAALVAGGTRLAHAFRARPHAGGARQRIAH